MLRVPVVGLTLLVVSPLFASGNDACIEGKVVDANGAPIPVTYVFSVNTERNVSHRVETNHDGTFRMDVPAGEYKLYTQDDGRFPNFGEVTSNEAGVRVTASPELCTSSILHGSQGPRARLHLTIQDAVTASALESAEAQFVRKGDFQWQGYIDAQGDLTVPPGTALKFEVFASGYQNSEALELPPLEPGERREISVTLRPVAMGCVKGTVVDADGTALPNIRLQLSPSPPNSGKQFWAYSDSKGEFEYAQVSPGPFSIFPEQFDYPRNPLKGGSHWDFSVPPGNGCANVPIQLGPKAAKLKVKVLDALTRKPIDSPDIWAHAHNDSAGWSSRIFAPSTPVPAFLEFQITVSARGYATSDAINIPELQPEEVKQIVVALRRDKQQSR